MRGGDGKERRLRWCRGAARRRSRNLRGRRLVGRGGRHRPGRPQRPSRRRALHAPVPVGSRAAAGRRPGGPGGRRRRGGAAGPGGGLRGPVPGRLGGVAAGGGPDRATWTGRAERAGLGAGANQPGRAVRVSPTGPVLRPGSLSKLAAARRRMMIRTAPLETRAVCGKGVAAPASLCQTQDPFPRANNVGKTGLLLSAELPSTAQAGRRVASHESLILAESTGRGSRLRDSARLGQPWRLPPGPPVQGPVPPPRLAELLGSKTIRRTAISDSSHRTIGGVATAELLGAQGALVAVAGACRPDGACARLVRNEARPGVAVRCPFARQKLLN